MISAELIYTNIIDTRLDMEQKKEAEISYRKGKDAYLHNAYEEAAEYLEEATRLSPDKLSFFYLGESLGRLKKHDKALDALKQAFNCLPKDRETKEHIIVLQCQAIQARMLEKFDLARKHNQAALEVAKRIFKEYDLETVKTEAEEEFQEIKKAELRQATMQVERALKVAEDMEKRKAYTEAVEEYTKIIKERTMSMLYLRRGKCLYFLQRYQDALSDFEEFAKKADYSSTIDVENECSYYKGLCWAETDNFDLSLKEFRRLFDRLHNTKENLRLRGLVVDHHNATRERMDVKERIRKKAPNKESRKREEVLEEGKVIKEALKNEKQLIVTFSFKP